MNIYYAEHALLQNVMYQALYKNGDIKDAHILINQVREDEKHFFTTVIWNLAWTIHK